MSKTIVALIALLAYGLAYLIITRMEKQGRRMTIPYGILSAVGALLCAILIFWK